MRKRRITWIIFAVFVLAVVFGLKPFLYWQNDTLGVTQYTILSEKLPAEFDGYKIVLLTDIHGKVFAEDNTPLYTAIEEEQADMLCLVGDLVDEGVENSQEVITDLLASCELPEHVYAVTGNHDEWSAGFDAFAQSLEEQHSIQFLENETIPIENDGAVIYLSGIPDPNTWNEQEALDAVALAEASVKKQEGYNILLFHRANMLDYFKDKAYDLVLSGHMHGGQVRIPFVGGLKSPHGDWFPAYSGGKYETGNQTYIVSRGIGNAVRVSRLLNRPELVVITLKCK